MPKSTIQQISNFIENDQYDTAGKKIEEFEKINPKLDKQEKLELLQTKAKLFSKTLETERIIDTKKEIYKLLDTEIANIEKVTSVDLESIGLWNLNLWDEAKKVSHNIKKQVSIQILDSLIERLMLEMSEKKKDQKERKDIEKMYFSELEILKNTWESDDAYFYESNYFRIKWDLDKEQEAIKKSALEWNRDSINKYLENLETKFLEEYNSLKTEEEKDKFLEENLEDIEEEFFQFIDNYSRDKNDKRIKLKQWWNKYLYEKVWNFYKNIWLENEALSSYKSWIQSSFKWYYKLYKNIAEIYENSNLKIYNNKKKLAKKEYYKLYQYSSINNDYENVFYSLNKLWHLSNSEEEKKQYFWEIIYNFETNYKLFINSEKIILNYLDALNNLDTKSIFNIEDLYTQLKNLNPENTILLADYFEKQWDFVNALKSYLKNNKIQNNKNSLDALLMFFEVSLLNNNNINNDEIKNLKKIIKKLEKNENILKEDIWFLVELSLKNKYYENLDISDINWNNANKVYGLEKMWDLVKKQKQYWIEQFPIKTDEWNFSKSKDSTDYYNEALEVIIRNKLLQTEEEIYSFLRISNKNWLKYSRYNLQIIENSLLSKDINNFLYLANYYEQNQDFESAIIHYLKGYKTYRFHIENWVKLNLEEQKSLNDSFIIFLKYNFKNKLKLNKEIFSNSLEDNILKKQEQLIEEEFQKELNLVDSIIKKIDKKEEISSSEIAFLFANSLEINFEQKIDINKFVTYINDYNNEEYSSNIYIQIILKQLILNKNINNKFIEKLISKVYKREDINWEEILKDINWIYAIPDISQPYQVKENKPVLNTEEEFLNIIIEHKNSKENTESNYIYEIISFLENELKQKIRKEIAKNNKQLINQIKEIDELIETLKQNKIITEEEIIYIFDLSIDDNYYQNFDMKQLYIFITIYNDKKAYWDLLLQNILVNLEFHFWFEDKEILAQFYKKISNKNHKQLTKEDILDLFDIFNPQFEEQKQQLKLQNKLLWILEEDTNTFEYTILLNEILKKSRK